MNWTGTPSISIIQLSAIMTRSDFSPIFQDITHDTAISGKRKSHFKVTTYALTGEQWGVCGLQGASARPGGRQSGALPLDQGVFML